MNSFFFIILLNAENVQRCHRLTVCTGPDFVRKPLQPSPAHLSASGRFCFIGFELGLDWVFLHIVAGLGPSTFFCKFQIEQNFFFSESSFAIIHCSSASPPPLPETVLNWNFINLFLQKITGMLRTC